jgi:hypothetical protein
VLLPRQRFKLERGANDKEQSMSMMSQKRSFRHVRGLSALPPIADIRRRLVQVGYWLRVYESTS